MAPKKKTLGSKESLSKEQKQRLIAAGRRREGKAERQKEEWRRSLTGKFLPGDKILEVSTAISSYESWISDVLMIGDVRSRMAPPDQLLK